MANPTPAAIQRVRSFVRVDTVVITTKGLGARGACTGARERFRFFQHGINHFLHGFSPLHEVNAKRVLFDNEQAITSAIDERQHQPDKANDGGEGSKNFHGLRVLLRSDGSECIWVSHQ